MTEEFTPLGSELKAHFAYGSIEEQAGKLELARQEQSAMAGKEMFVSNVSHTHYVDANGKDVYEVWATFKPVVPREYPEVKPQASDGTL